MNAGDVVYVLYHGDPGVYHTRLLTADLGNDEWMIITPAMDCYAEEYHARNGDINRFWHAADGRVPRGIPVGDLLRLGRREATAEFARRGVAPAAAARAAPPAAPSWLLPVGAPAPAVDASVWVLAEMVKGHKIGERVVPGAGLVQSGDWGLQDFTDSDGTSRPCLIRRIEVLISLISVMSGCSWRDLRRRARAMSFPVRMM